MIGYLLAADAAWRTAEGEATEARDRADRKHQDPPPAEAAATLARLAARCADALVEVADQASATDLDGGAVRRQPAALQEETVP